MPVKHLPAPQIDRDAPVLADYLSGLSLSYRRQLDSVLRKWCAFLEVFGIRRTPELLRTDPTAWNFVTSDLLYQYRQLLLHEAYVNATVNRHLAMLRAFIYTVYGAGGIPENADLYHILRTRSYPARSGTPSPYPSGPATAEAAPEGEPRLSPVQVEQLKHRHPDTPQGRRDALLFCLLLDQGLLVSTLATLQAQDFDREQGVLRFHSSRDGEEQVHPLSPDTVHAFHAYLATDPILRSGKLFRAIRKNGTLGKGAMAPGHIVARVRVAGKQILGTSTLKVQDCRQYWATTSTRRATDNKL
jgi:integrase